MQKSVLIAAALFALGGCVSHDFSEGERTNYACADGKQFSYREVAGAREVFAGGETSRLTLAADGQWTNERVRLSESGGGAALAGANGGPYENCRRRAGDWWFRFW